VRFFGGGNSGDGERPNPARMGGPLWDSLILAERGEETAGFILTKACPRLAERVVTAFSGDVDHLHLAAFFAK